MPGKTSKDNEAQFNETLKRMLKTPPKPHQASPKPKDENKSPKSEQTGDETICKN
ncbi:hypothetical protein NKG60_27955 [Mesorhizobium sp. M1428]|uniref:hypothetical protein n=1 Tax=Mesorhizobium sp. M1428 TaxID=2957102 RepID=UPI00333B9465